MDFNIPIADLNKLIIEIEQILAGKRTAIPKQEKNQLRKLDKLHLLNVGPYAHELNMLTNERHQLEIQETAQFIEKVSNTSGQDLLEDTTNLTGLLDSLGKKIVTCRNIMKGFADSRVAQRENILNQALLNLDTLEKLTEKLNIWRGKLQTVEWTICSNILDQEIKVALKGCGINKVALESEKKNKLSVKWNAAVAREEIDYVMDYDSYVASGACNTILEGYEERLKPILAEELRIKAKITKEFDDRINKSLNEITSELKSIKNEELEIKIEVSVEEEIEEEQSLEKAPVECLIASRKNSNELNSNLSPSQNECIEDRVKQNPHINKKLTCDSIKETIQAIRKKHLKVQEEDLQQLNSLAFAVHYKCSWKLIDAFWKQLFSSTKTDAEKRKYLPMFDSSLKVLLEKRERLGDIDVHSSQAGHYRSSRKEIFKYLYKIANLSEYKEFEDNYPTNPTFQDPLGKWVKALNEKNNNLYTSIWEYNENQIMTQIYETLFRNNDEIVNTAFLKDLFDTVTHNCPTNSRIFSRFFRKISSDSRIIEGNFGYHDAISEFNVSFDLYVTNNSHTFKKEEAKPAQDKMDLLNSLVKKETLEKESSTENKVNLQQYGFFQGPLTKANSNSEINNGRPNGEERSFSDDEEEVVKKLKIQ